MHNCSEWAKISDDADTVNIVGSMMTALSDHTSGINMIKYLP